MKKYNFTLKELRLKKRLTIKNLAKLLSISTSTLSKYENKLTSPNSNILFKLCVIFNVRLDYLLGLSNIKKPLISYEKYKDILK